MDEDSRLTIEHLRAQPRGGVVRWASDHVSTEQPWATGWIDIRIADGGPAGMGWVWTILSPDDPDQGEPEQLWQFPWPHDLAIHSAVESGRHTYVRGGWSTQAVAEALSWWAARHAGRGDLRFEWDGGAGDSETLILVKERAEAGGPTWDLGEGLKVADGVMDDLLALDLEEAGRITAILREAANRLNDHA